MIDQLKPLLGKLALFSQERLGFKHPPRLFLRNDSQNSQQALGKTAFYNPQEQSVTLFIHGRHPKDILRSFTHELVHHCQNERGDLTSEKMGEMGSNYAQDNDHMRKMEQEAYLEGNMCFRDWEDTIEDKDLILIKLAESKFLKENKTMTTKITKEFLKETIRKILAEQAPVMSAPAAEGDKAIASHKAVIAQYEKGNSAVSEEDYERAVAAVAAASKKKPEARPVLPDPIKAKKGYEAFAQGAVGLEEGGCGSAPGKRCDDKSCSSCYPMEEANEIEENEELEEGKGHKCKAKKCLGKDCPACSGKGGKCKCEEAEGINENEELEEASDKDGDGHVVPDWADQNDNDPKVGPKSPKSESKIQTPEQENTLYEQRFAAKNNRLFEKLVKEWTK